MRYGPFRLVATTLVVMVAAGSLALQAQAPAGAPPDPAAGHSVRAAIERWFDLQAATLMARYRRLESSTGVVVANHMQDSVLLRARVKFDAKGRYALNGTIQTGSNFTAAWNNVGWGTGGPRQTGVFLKHAYLTAAPIQGVEFAYGSMGFVRGESTEITTYDNDGYVLGGRVTIHRPEQLFLDEISVSEGYFGSPAEPGLSDRISKAGDVNFFHALGGKKIGRAAAVSADYTYQDTASIVRGALSLQTPKARVIDTVRYEHYCRVVRLPDCGFAATVTKAVHPRVMLSGGYSDIDPDFGGVNGDRYTRGRRVFEQFSMRVLRDFTLTAYATQAFHNTFVVVNNRRVDLIVSYNALGPLQRAGFFR